MTNPTPHGQVPEALRLADEISKAGAYPRAPYEAAAAELRRLHAQVAALTAAPQGVAYAELPEPTPDELRAIARKARNNSGSASDDCGPLAYVLHGWRAAAIAFRAQQAALVEAQQPALSAAPAFQQRVQPWLLECFGAEIAADRMERNHRFLEESLELVQSLGCTASEAHQLVDYVFGRPVGDPPQEVGGVMVTLAALCLASGLDMHDAGEVELVRISVPEIVAKIRAKQAAKPKHSPLPQSPPPQADSQPAPVEVADAMADSQYLAGVSAGWNAANADDPNAALQKLHESRAGYLKPLRAGRATADSVLDDAETPMQPICIASDGVIRFKQNRMVNDLYEFSQPRGFGLNEMARRDYTQEERMQFAQLIGYSVSGYGGLSYASLESAEKADAIAASLIAAREQGANHD